MHYKMILCILHFKISIMQKKKKQKQNKQKHKQT